MTAQNTKQQSQSYRPRTAKHCVLCGAVLPKFKRKYCSDECFDKWFCTIAIKDWDKVRSIALKRDHYICQRCGLKQDCYHRMEAHHIIPIYMGGEEFNLENCITLCHTCHVEVHREIVIEAKIPETQKKIGEF